MSKKTVPLQGLEPTGQIVGYARVSSPEQNLDRQTNRFAEAGVDVADTTVPMRASVRRAFGTNPSVPAVYRELADEVKEAVS